MLYRAGIWVLFILYGLQYYLYSRGLRFLSYLVELAPYTFIILIATANKSRLFKRTLSYDISIKRSFTLLIFFILFAFYRAVPNGYHSSARFLYNVLLIFIFTSYFNTYVRYIYSHYDRFTVWSDLVTGLMFVILTNYILLYGFGIESMQAQTYISTMSSNFGLTESRIFFPIAFNAREYSQYCGLLSVISFGLLLRNKANDRAAKRRNRALFINIVVGIATVLIVDARMTLGITIFAMMVLFVLKYRDLRIPIFFTSILVFLLFPALYFLALILFKIEIDWVSASNTFSGRLYIWATGLINFPNLSFVDLLFGKGIFSHATLGLSQYYGLLFENWVDNSRIQLHNGTIQNLYDLGIVGLGVFLWFIISMVVPLFKGCRDGKNHDTYWFNVIAMTSILYYQGLWVTESTTPLYFLSYLLLLLFFKAVIGTLPSPPGKGVETSKT